MSDLSSWVGPEMVDLTNGVSELHNGDVEKELNRFLEAERKRNQTSVSFVHDPEYLKALSLPEAITCREE